MLNNHFQSPKIVSYSTSSKNMGVILLSVVSLNENEIQKFCTDELQLRHRMDGLKQKSSSNVLLRSTFWVSKVS